MGNTTPSVLDSLLDVTAKHFKEPREKLSLTTNFVTDLNADAHDMEELRVDYEDARGVLIHESFDGIRTIDALFAVVAKYS